MDVVSNEGLPIEGQRLTAWAVLHGGTRIRLDFISNDGITHRIVLPFDALTGQAMDPAVPFGGYKMSGYGRESGVQHLEEYLNVKSVWIKTD